MKTFPMFLKMQGRRVVIIGGGEQAAQKCRLMLKTEAEIVVSAAVLEPELQALADAERIAHHAAPVTRSLFDNTILAFVATGCPGADAAYQRLAHAAGVLVNVVDAMDLCDAITPSIVDRSPLVVAIGTEGTAPVLARQTKTRIEAMLEPRLGELASAAGRLRAAVARRIGREERRAFWHWVFSGPPRNAHARGAERSAISAIKHAIAAGGPPEGSGNGQVSLVGAGPGCRDLITMRGVRRLQEADVIFYDRLVDPEVLELARRDAERVYVGKTPGTAAWPQGRINGLIVAAARQGQNVVRLKCGDPGIFARGAEEVAALDAAGIQWEIVPGVTAASAAAAVAGGFLTERGVTDTVVLSTGHVRDGDKDAAFAPHLVPGTTLALYMAIRKVDRVQSSLLDAGHDPATPVEIVSKAGSPNQIVLKTTLGDLAHTVRSRGIENPALLLIRRPKQDAQERTWTLMPGRARLAAVFTDSTAASVKTGTATSSAAG